MAEPACGTLWIYLQNETAPSASFQGKHMQRVAVFLDAGYFFAQVSKSLGIDVNRRELIELNFKALRQEVLDEVDRQFPGAPLLRVYWYDGPGVAGKNNVHRSIDELDDFKLKLGARNGLGEQKEVDGLIIADMLGLVYAKALSDILLVSGDADITPGVVAAQAQGARVHVLSIGTVAAMSNHLRAEADHKASWSEETVRKFASPAPAPSEPEPQLPAADFEAMARQFCETHAGPALSGIDPRERILPKEIDSSLLYFARSALGRALESSEKRALREGLRSSLLAKTPTDSGEPCQLALFGNDEPSPNV